MDSTTILAIVTVCATLAIQIVLALTLKKHWWIHLIPVLLFAAVTGGLLLSASIIQGLKALTLLIYALFTGIATVSSAGGLIIAVIIRVIRKKIRQKRDTGTQEEPSAKINENEQEMP